MTDAITILAVLRQQRESQLEMVNHLISQHEDIRREDTKLHVLDLRVIRGMLSRHRQEVDALISDDLEALYDEKMQFYADAQAEMEGEY